MRDVLNSQTNTWSWSPLHLSQWFQSSGTSAASLLTLVSTHMLHTSLVSTQRSWLGVSTWTASSKAWECTSQTFKIAQHQCSSNFSQLLYIHCGAGSSSSNLIMEYMGLLLHRILLIPYNLWSFKCIWEWVRMNLINNSFAYHLSDHLKTSLLSLIWLSILCSKSSLKLVPMKQLLSWVASSQSRCKLPTPLYGHWLTS